MRTNTAVPPVYTHEGARASHISKLEELRRAVLSCLLWEDNFYESGVSIAERITTLVAGFRDSTDVAALAIQARNEYRLRHVPLLLAVGLARKGYKGTADVLFEIIQRPDELTEFLSLYWAGKKCPLSAQVKKGLARAFTKFNAYQLSKYNRDDAIKLRDVLFLSHAKPKTDAQAATWKALVNGTLQAADTWETNLSAGKDKKETFTRLLAENKLGYMALLRNLRNMKEAGIAKSVIASKLIDGAATGKALPFRYIAAASAVPAWEDIIDQALQASFTGQVKLLGRTVVVVDRSGSMNARLSTKSTMLRQSAANALAGIIVGLSEDPVVYATAGNDHTRIHATVELPPRSGMALNDAIYAADIGGGGIFLTQCMDKVYETYRSAERVIVITDEQDCDTKLTPDKAKMIGNKNYIINLASYQCGIAYDKFTHINGFSESVVRFILESESLVRKDVQDISTGDALLDGG